MNRRERLLLRSVFLGGEFVPRIARAIEQLERCSMAC